MHGNVWEWCRDWYDGRLPAGRDPDLSNVPGERNNDGTYSRVRRDGAWIEGSRANRSAMRLRYEPSRGSQSHRLPHSPRPALRPSFALRRNEKRPTRRCATPDPVVAPRHCNEVCGYQERPQFGPWQRIGLLPPRA